MIETIKGFRGKDGPILLDYSGVANVPGALESIAGMAAKVGDQFEVASVDDAGKVKTVRPISTNVKSVGGVGPDGTGNVPLDWVATRTVRIDQAGEALVPEVVMAAGVSKAFNYDTIAGQEELAVLCDGKLYLCTPKFNSEGGGDCTEYYFHLGNASLRSGSAPNTGEPFFFHGYSGASSPVVAYFSTAGEHTIEIYGGKEVLIYNKMPKEFLPDGVGNGSGQNVYNVRTYGAIGDGTTDDTDAIAAAIAALPTGGTLHFPAGTYMVDNVFAKSDMTIQGDGWGSVIKLLPARTNYHGRNSCINIEGVERVIVRDIKLDGDRATQQATAAAQDARLNGLFITSAKDIYIENVWMYNNGYHGCIMVGVENVTFSHCRSSFNGFRPIHGHTEIYNVRVSNCICEDNGKGLTGGSGFENDAVFFFGVQRLTINDNIVRSNRRGCICVGADHSSVTTGTIIPSGSISITGNVCECYEDLPYVPTAESDTGVAKFSSQGIVVYGSDGEMRNVTVSGNTIKNAHEAIYLYASDNLVTSLNAAVTGNTIIDCSIGVKAVEVADITITGNQFRNLAEQMMYAQSVERLLVSGNNVYAPGTSEYRLCSVHGSSNVVITGNQFVCPARIAVYAPDSNANVVITNNVMLGFADENPITNTNGVTQNNIIGKTAVEPEPDDGGDTGDGGDAGDGGDTGDGDYPDDSDVETEKVYAGAYENAGFVRLNLASPNTGSVAYVHTTPIPMTDADTRYELNTYVPINDEGVEPEGYTGIGADKEPSIVFLSGDDHMTDAVGIVPMFTRTNGTWSYNANNFITNAANRIFGFTISISAKKVRELFPTATHVMFQVEKSSDPDAVSSVTFGPLGDGKSYVYRAVTE